MHSLRNLLILCAVLSAANASSNSEVHLGVALIDFIMQVPPTTSNVNLSTTHVYQLETTLSEWMDQQLKASVYATDRDFLHASYQIMDQSTVVMITPTNEVIANRVLNGQLDFVYSGATINNFDKYWNNFIKTKTDSAILQSMNVILSSYTPSSTSAVSSYYFSPCLNTVSQVVSMTNGSKSNSDSAIRGLIVAISILGVFLFGTWIYIVCFSTLCMSMKNKLTSSWDEIFICRKDASKEIAPCDTFSTDGSTKVSNVKHEVLGAVSLPKNYASKKRKENMSQYDMESASMSPTSKASDSSSVTGRNPLGIMSMQTLRRLMYSPRKEANVFHQDPYNMSMNGSISVREDADEGQDDVSQREQDSPMTVKPIEY